MAKKEKKEKDDVPLMPRNHITRLKKMFSMESRSAVNLDNLN
jgi:hypothetical protein